MKRTVAVGLSLLALVACDSGPGEEDAKAPEAPAFELEDLEGNQVSLSDFAGRTVVIDFWATWCRPCVHQIPVLNEFKAAREDVAVLGISVDAGGREVVAPFAEEHGIAYPVLLGDESLALRYGAPGFPALAVVTPQGRIGSLHVGVVAPKDLDAAVESAEGG